MKRIKSQKEKMKKNISAAIERLSAFITGCVKLALPKRPEVRNMANANNQPGSGISTNGLKTFGATTLAEWTAFAAAYPNVTVQPPGRYALVKLGTAGLVAISASATDKIIGIAQDAPDADLDPINVRLINSPGTALVVAGAAITLGDFVQSNADGSVKTAVSTGFVIGRAIQAATGAGDVIEIMLMTDPAALI